MDEGERWILFDGPEPEQVRAVLDVLRQVPPATAEEDARFQREFFEKLDAQTGGAPPSEDGQDEAAAATPPPRAVESLAGPATEGGVTARSPMLDGLGRCDTPPVAGQKAPEPVDEAPAPTGVPRPPVRFAGTAPIPTEVRKQSAALPFLAPEQVPAAKKSARTVPVPVMKKRGLAETVPAGNDAITRAVAALPFAASASRAAEVVAFPTLKVNEYASLRAELSVTPTIAGQILARYQVTSPAAQGALDAHWGRRFAEEAGLRAEFERAFGEFVGWLRMQRR
jgi:hypothetical protein